MSEAGSRAKPRKKRRIIAASLVAALVVGLGGLGIWQWSLESSATNAYAQADAALREANGDRNRAAAELNSLRADAMAAHAKAVQIASAIDPALLETPTVAADLTEAATSLATAASLEQGDDGQPALPEAVLLTRVPTQAAPEGRDAKVSAATRLAADKGARSRDADALERQIDGIEEAASNVERLELELVKSAYAKGSATQLPELASQEAKDGFAAAVAGLKSPDQSADLVPLLQGYRDALAAAIASGEEAARRQDPDSAGPTYINGILIANKTYALPSWWGDGLTAETVAAFNAMSAEAAGSGHNLYISSGFRSYASQAAIYNSLVAQVGVAGADRDTARPGHSEHQTGLTVDLNCICEGFGYQADGQWVAANAHRFGFIVRYPQGKENVTGYIWEPWHLRYLGVDTATAVYNSGVSLEEFLGITSSYG